MLSELQLKAKLGSARPSDEVEGVKFEIKWEPMKNTLGVVIDLDESMEIIGELLVVGLCEIGTIKPHVSSRNRTTSISRRCSRRSSIPMLELSLKYSSCNSDAAQRAMCFLLRGKSSWALTVRIVDSYAKGYLSLCVGGYHVLRVHLCADEVVLVSIDVRTGRVNLRDTGDLAAASRGPQFAIISDGLNDNPGMLLMALVRLRFNVSQSVEFCMKI